MATHFWVRCPPFLGTEEQGSGQRAKQLMGPRKWKEGGLRSFSLKCSPVQKSKLTALDRSMLTAPRENAVTPACPVPASHCHRS